MIQNAKEADTDRSRNEENRKGEPVGDKSPGAPAVRQAIEIMNHLQGFASGVSLASISRELSIPKSTALRVLRELVKGGYVHSDTDTGRYSLGPRLLTLGHAVIKQSGLLKTSLPHLERLSEEVGETVKLTVLQGREVIVLYYIKGSMKMQISTDVGNQLPLHAGAASKVLLSSLSDPEIRRFAGHKLHRYTPNTITAPDELLSAVKVLRDRGYAKDDQEYMNGVAAVAAPVRNYTGQIVAALSIAYFAAPEEQDKAQALVPALLATAARISRELGVPS